MVPLRGSTETPTLHAPRHLTCLDRPLLSTPAALYAHRRVPVQEAESMRSGPQTSSAVTTRLPSPRMGTSVLMLSPRNPWKAKEAAPNHHPCHKQPETRNHTQPHLYKPNPTTTALHQQTCPLLLPNSSTVAHIHRQLRQRRTLLLLTLQHQPHQTRDSVRLLHPLSGLRLHQIHTPNLALSLSRPPILQRLQLYLPLWHQQYSSLRTRPKPKLPELQPQHKSSDLLQPGNLTQKLQKPPPTPHLPQHLPPQLHHYPPSRPPAVWRAPRSLIPQFLALPLWVGG